MDTYLVADFTFGILSNPYRSLGRILYFYDCIELECFAFSALEIICYKKKACVINSSEKSGFLRFYVYLCLMSDILYLGFSSTGISEFSDMGKY